MNTSKTIYVVAAAVIASALTITPLTFAAVAADAPMHASTCSVRDSSISFSSYTSNDNRQTGNIAIVCTNGTVYNVGLGPGKGSEGNTATRVMTSKTGDLLNYDLYIDLARTQIWRSDSTSDTRTEIGTGDIQNLTIYGYIPANQNPRSGVYSDMVTIMLTY